MATQMYKVLILGGGNAAGYAARELVKKGIGKSEAAIVSKEAVAPYERPALSKAFLFANPPARLPGFHTCVGDGGERQAPEWYAQNGIDLILNEEITSANLATKTLQSKAGTTFKYEKLIIATGCSPIFLSKLEGAGLKGVHYLRENADGLELYEALHAHKGEEVVIVGGGYIGLEVGAAASIIGCKPKLVFPEENVMPRLFFPEMAKFYEDYYQGKGVELYYNGYLCEGFLGDDDGHVRGIKMCRNDKQEELSGKLVVVGVGARPNTLLFKDQLAMEMGGIKVDYSLKTSVDDVYAIGDVITFPVKMYGGELTRMEHVKHARQSAAHAVNAIFGSKEEYDYLPYFYSRVFDLSWQFFGKNIGDKKIFISKEGDKKLAAFWLKDEQVTGVFGESPSAENTEQMSKIALAMPLVNAEKLSAMGSADEAYAYVSSI